MSNSCSSRIWSINYRCWENFWEECSVAVEEGVQPRSRTCCCWSVIKWTTPCCWNSCGCCCVSVARMETQLRLDPLWLKEPSAFVWNHCCWILSVYLLKEHSAVKSLYGTAVGSAVRKRPAADLETNPDDLLRGLGSGFERPADAAPQLRPAAAGDQYRWPSPRPRGTPANAAPQLRPVAAGDQSRWPSLRPRWTGAPRWCRTSVAACSCRWPVQMTVAAACRWTGAPRWCRTLVAASSCRWPVQMTVAAAKGYPH